MRAVIQRVSSARVSIDGRAAGAIPLDEKFLAQTESALGRPVASGEFGAMMPVALVNDGRVALVIDSRPRE